jgi:hypothetical protein
MCFWFGLQIRVNERMSRTGRWTTLIDLQSSAGAWEGQGVVTELGTGDIQWHRNGAVRDRLRTQHAQVLHPHRRHLHAAGSLDATVLLRVVTKMTVNPLKRSGYYMYHLL